jgi:hypothetical protein
MSAQDWILFAIVMLPGIPLGILAGIIVGVGLRDK